MEVPEAEPSVTKEGLHHVTPVVPLPSLRTRIRPLARTPQEWSGSHSCRGRNFLQERRKPPVAVFVGV